jgi:hypothetical protein
MGIESLTIDWLDENKFRAYPLVEHITISIPNQILEAQCILVDASLVFMTTPPLKVLLDSITISGADVVFSVSGQPTFTVVNYQSADYPYYVRNTLGSLLVISECVKQVTLPTFFVDATFEASVVHDMSGAWQGVNSISYNSIHSVAGPMEWLEGYQFKIDIEDNDITLGARKNYGIPISCQEFFPDMVSDCPDIISYMNSVGVSSSPGKFHFLAGQNVVILDDPENHRIYIGLNFDEDNICKAITPNPQGR